ncbi:MAG: hypothetical protein OXN84_21430 [Albidovulum sp.]|nr:hypothetical protein [Albidovulum sp.]
MQSPLTSILYKRGSATSPSPIVPIRLGTSRQTVPPPPPRRDAQFDEWHLVRIVAENAPVFEKFRNFAIWLSQQHPASASQASSQIGALEEFTVAEYRVSEDHRQEAAQRNGDSSNSKLLVALNFIRLKQADHCNPHVLQHM